MDKDGRKELVDREDGEEEQAVSKGGWEGQIIKTGAGKWIKREEQIERKGGEEVEKRNR